MGIDKSNVRFVAHLDMPRSIEGYYQETGRAGRDGLPADAWMAYGMGDIVLQQRMIESSDAPPERKRIEKGKLDAILGFSESSGCRREVLLRYFGEDYSGPCGNCDTCINPIETWDGTVEAQKALSCIYRTGQHFGAAYLTDILTGKTNERIEGFGHDKLQVFGIGKEHDSRLWRSIFRQLLARGHAGIDTEGFNTLRLTEKARPVLSGTEEVFFRKDLIVVSKKSRRARGATKDIAPSSSEGILLETLKAHRLALATKQGVPPYVIFHDATLLEMATTRPARLEDMLDITGIAQKKLQKYCQGFLDIIITAN
jgi:ATP-dependent DNA helicase RecQ